MIITQKKPIEELMAMIGDAQKIAILGCGSCATACATGGEKEVAELKAYLESQGKTVVDVYKRQHAGFPGGGAGHDLSEGMHEGKGFRRRSSGMCGQRPAGRPWRSLL